MHAMLDVRESGALTPDLAGLAPALPAGTPATQIALDTLQRRLKAAKRSYATRRIDLARADGLLSGDACPRPGDLVLARIVQLGHHKRIESPEGRRAELYIGDEVLLCYGARYASDQFEALVPGDLGPCEMVAGGGIAARAISRHSATRAPTRIEPLGLVADRAKRVLNLADHALGTCRTDRRSPYTIAVLGTSMNAGKTTTAAALVRGLAAQGFRPGAVKVTGTGAGGDRWALVDAGASPVLDFTDFGHASTYRVPVGETASILRRAHAHLAAAGCDVAVVEIADGLLFPETVGLIETPEARTLIDGVIVAAGDALGAVASVACLDRLGLPVLAVAGKLTSSPLAMREAAAALFHPIVPLDALTNGLWLAPALAARRAAGAAA
ncbi:DUF1611 domain-containing protein [Futiania mangrovi]|uniref:DUF1611 domain-containing protein n=1 Tax=Futiania mangrovi TaxID=2959716 RepID=A0A9J6PHB4_9PROT|nr:DUF1611 domain-containing protein [Futiania mangrovii]MCP1335482.1 DUF1611 domain-containing protein [Futiania mangrovii]